MSGTVQYECINESQLFDALDTPAIIRYRPGRIIVRADAREMIYDPQLIDQLNAVGEALISPYAMQGVRQSTPTVRCQVYRVQRLPNSRLVAGEIVDNVACVEVAARFISSDLAAALSSLGTNVGHYLTPA